LILPAGLAAGSVNLNYTGTNYVAGCRLTAATRSSPTAQSAQSDQARLIQAPFLQVVVSLLAAAFRLSRHHRSQFITLAIR